MLVFSILLPIALWKNDVHQASPLFLYLVVLSLKDDILNITQCVWRDKVVRMEVHALRFPYFNDYVNGGVDSYHTYPMILRVAGAANNPKYKSQKPRPVGLDGDFISYINNALVSTPDPNLLLPMHQSFRLGSTPELITKPMSDSAGFRVRTSQRVASSIVSIVKH